MTADLGPHRAEASTQPSNLGSPSVLRASLLWERALTPDPAPRDSTDC
jgi:hypothetical protein